MTAPEDLNLDELRRRARRRLVGAIVLALVVAVVVPMLLESDPRPLGEDVSVKIPPIDEGKFVNRLSEKDKEKDKDKGKPEPAKAAAPKPAPPAEVVKSEPPKPVAPVEPPKAAQAPAASEPAPAAPETVAKAPSPSNDGATGAAPVAGDFAVQVFAFTDDKGANSLVNKLKAKGFSMYSEPVTTSKGTLWRVRAGPFATRDSAVSAREKLKGEGYNGIVVSAK